MGCFWSCEGTDRCHHSHSRDECPICIDRASHYAIRPQGCIRLRSLFGEYRCSCGRKWQSRKSWRGHFQVCKRCRKNVYPHTQRELRPGDITRNRKNAQDHPQELCQMCMELGYYCGKLSG